MVVVWNTMNISKGGEVAILAKAHTDVDIHTMKVAFFDDTRYPPFSLFFSANMFEVCTANIGYKFIFTHIPYVVRRPVSPTDVS